MARDAPLIALIALRLALRMAFVSCRDALLSEVTAISDATSMVRSAILPASPTVLDANELVFLNLYAASYYASDEAFSAWSIAFPSS